jgi:voltage-gated potassium channel
MRPGVGAHYARAMYYVLITWLTVGYGDNVTPVSPAETVFTCACMLVGVCVFGLLIANVTSLLANRDVATSRFRSKMQTIKSYLGFRGIPADIRARVCGHFDVLYEKQGGMSGSDILGTLPEKLRADVLLCCAPVSVCTHTYGITHPHTQTAPAHGAVLRHRP